MIILKINIITTVLYPIAITSVLYTAIASYITIRRGTMKWKDRLIRDAVPVIGYESGEEDESLDDVSETSTGKSEP